MSAPHNAASRELVFNTDARTASGMPRSFAGNSVPARAGVEEVFPDPAFPYRLPPAACRRFASSGALLLHL